MPQATPALSESANPLPGGLASQLDVATPILQLNNWVSKPQLDHIRAKALDTPPPTPAAGRSLLAQFLLDHRLLPREQIYDLDSILKNQVTLPQFQLQRKLGAGGMGIVFLAKHLATDRLVALKTINARLAEDGDFVERFHREANALGKIHDEHVAEIVESGMSEGTCWLAMEYIDGPSLMSLLKEHRLLPERYALGLARQIAEGLGHVWAKAGLVHRDIKPENVLVIRNRGSDALFSLDDVAKLIDFGLVKSNNEDDRLTQTGMTIGTPLYMSPEQVRGEKLDCRSDVYGLGATLYHLLTGATPFQGSSPGAIMSAHLTEPVPDPGDRVPSLSKQTRQVVMTAMAKDAAKRFVNFEAMLAACTAAIQALDNRSGTMPKLLRKPLVMKNPVRRSGEWTVDGPVAAPPAAGHSSNPPPLSAFAGGSGATTISNPNGAERETPPLRPMAPNPPTNKPATATSIPPRPAALPKPGIPAPASATAASASTSRSPKNAPATLGVTGSASPGTRTAIRGGAVIGTVGSSSSSGAGAAASTGSPDTSSYAEPPESPGTGMLPWVVCGIALLTLVAFILKSVLS